MYKLLLVEDEDTIREGFHILIRQVSNEFEVCWEASHGREAMEVLAANLPDAVITDIRMREMDGLALSAAIRKRYPHLPIVIISGHSDFEYAHQAIQIGIVDYLVKPIKRTALIQALDRIKKGLRTSTEPTGTIHSVEASEPDESESHQLIRKVKAYIRNHPDSDLRLPSLANIVHLNPAYLSQLFKAVTQCNVTEYVTEVRMEKACQLLVSTSLKVYDIARLSGYQSPKHFTLTFKEYTGCTPTEYRAQNSNDSNST